MPKQGRDFWFEEIEVDDDDNDDEKDESDKDEFHELDRQISKSKKGYSIDISETTAARLYDEAGSEEEDKDSIMVVLPSRQILSTTEELAIMKAKTDLSIKHDIDKFQVQALVSLLRGENVVLIAPCGSGKLLVFHMGVYLLREKFNLHNGVGLCLQPLNNILTEKTNSHPPIKTAYLTMTGDAVQAGNASLSHSLEEISSGEIGCVLGHAESFLSVRGKGNAC